MKSLFFLIAVSFLLSFFSCQPSKEKSLHKDSEKHWSYEGETSPEHWIEIEKNSSCDGEKQSPINIIHKDAVIAPLKNELSVNYSSKTLVSKVENNGHSIQFDFEYGDSIVYKNETYLLKQIHFHEPSEHKINGIVYPIEIHLVHVNHSGKITVLGVFGEEGSESDLFEFLESFLPLENGTHKEIHQELDLSILLKNKQSYYSYSGSLTTPPCEENVNWIVFKNPIILSETEVLKLKDNMPINNYRNQQDINNRKVFFYE